MCGRFALTASAEEVEQHFALQQSFALKPLYNISPSNLLLAITGAKHRKLNFFEWGYRPSWGKKSKYNIKPQINARLETITDKPMFREGFLWRRCLLVASGFYEWTNVGGHKYPHYITINPSRSVFAFAGIYDEESCAILTYQASSSILRLHQRMPLILKPNFYNDWLDIGKEFDIGNSSKIFYEENFTAYPVSRSVNAPSFNGKECISPIS